MVVKRKSFKSTGKLHICSRGVDRVAVKGSEHKMSKEVREYLKDKLDRLIEIRDNMGKEYKRKP